ncbi:hypothetical protein ScalyP_jg4548 [Parmales sp. scaly parma]|nr:hypothetical protein ScalyP_jg4548 [Parmales sp. scaly parma]
MNTCCCFVTVGTTSFPTLVANTNSPAFLKLLKTHNFTKLIVQHGNGIPPPPPPHTTHIPFTKITTYDFKTSLSADMNSAKLIVTHGGAGSIMECLARVRADPETRILVVVNTDLMDNHQIEIAEELGEHNYVHFISLGSDNSDSEASFVEALEFCLSEEGKLEVYEEPDPKTFSNFVDQHMGVV